MDLNNVGIEVSTVEYSKWLDKGNHSQELVVDVTGVAVVVLIVAAVVVVVIHH
jgi:hypothetical protein